jgi:hypothetical protein
MHVSGDTVAISNCDNCDTFRGWILFPPAPIRHLRAHAARFPTNGTMQAMDCVYNGYIHNGAGNQKMNLDQQLDGIQSRRMSAQSRFLDTIDAREEAAEEMLGQIIRDGKIVYYVTQHGGKYREGTRLELVAFLIRNRYA